MSVNLFTSSFKNKSIKSKNIYRVLFFVILLLLLLVVGQLFQSIHNRNISSNDFYPSKRWKEFYSTEENSIDLLFMGSSHAYRSFDPEIFDSLLNTNSFNLGSSSQMLDTSYYVLHEVLRHQNPKTIVLEVYFEVMEKDNMIVQAKYNYEFMENSKVKRNFWNNVFTSKDKLEYSLKILRYRKDFITFLNNPSFNKPVQNRYEEYYKNKGFVYNNDVIDTHDLIYNNDFTNYSIQMSDIQLNYLQKFISDCKAANINLLLVTAPLPPSSYKLVDDYDLFHNQIKQIASKQNIKYIDYNLINQEMNIFNDHLFMDDDHLNYEGVTIMNNDLIKYIDNVNY